VPARDLERDQAHLPGPGRDRERALDPADVQHVDGTGAERDRPADRDGVDEAAVEIVRAVNLDRGQQAGHRARRHDGRDERAAAEPARRRVLDAGRDTVERQRQVGEVPGGETVGEEPVQRLDRVMKDLEAAVEKMPEEKLALKAPLISHISTHNAYHTGQILYVRKLQGSWNPENGVK